MVGRSAGRRDAPAGTFPLAALTLVLLLILFSAQLSRGAETSSSGYLLGRAGEVSQTAFIVTPSVTGENVPVRLYFSEPALEPFFSLVSDSKNWNGGGFVGLTRQANFYLSYKGVPESLAFENHTIWVEIGGVNSTVRFFPVPGEFYTGGREVPPSVVATRVIRQSTLELLPGSSRRLPVEVSILVW